MTKYLFAASMLALAAVPAAAQTAPADAFNGFYVGGQAGWQRDTQNLEIGDTSIGEGASGFAYGAQAGYDFKLGGSAVLGAEVSLTGRTGETNFEDFDLSQGRTINATARLGIMTDPMGLFYVRGGYSNARFTADDGFERVSENRDGYTVGAGYERYLTQNVSARLEYNYSNYGTDNLSELFEANSELKYYRHAVTAGVNFRF